MSVASKSPATPLKPIFSPVPGQSIEHIEIEDDQPVDSVFSRTNNAGCCSCNSTQPWPGCRRG